MALNRVRISKTKARNVDKYGAYHPPVHYERRPPSRPLSRHTPVHTPIKQASIDLTNEFRRSIILGIPRDAIPEYLGELTKEYGHSAVYSAVLQQYDIYKLSPSPTRDWLEAAMKYLKDR